MTKEQVISNYLSFINETRPISYCIMESIAFVDIFCYTEVEKMFKCKEQKINDILLKIFNKSIKPIDKRFIGVKKNTTGGLWGYSGYKPQKRNGSSKASRKLNIR